MHLISVMRRSGMMSWSACLVVGESDGVIMDALETFVRRIQLGQERSQSRVIRFDESPVPGAAPGDLDPDLTRRFMRDNGDILIRTLV
jgi:hypothetical protein